MDQCQYEFQFQNEYMNILEDRIGSLLGIVINEKNMLRVEKGGQSFILRKKDKNNFMLFSANDCSYIYLVIVVCEKKFEEDLKEIFFDICMEIEEDYNEDHRHEVKDVKNTMDNWLNVFSKKYDVHKLFDI